MKLRAQTTAPQEAWRSLLPPGVFFSAGPLLTDAPALTPREHASAGPASTERMRELQSGREYAKRALAMLGIPAAELLVGPDRAPGWPTGVVGSLTHAHTHPAGHVAAAVARSGTVCALGIDAESDDGLPPHIWPYVLTCAEQQALCQVAPRARPIQAKLVWCAKEAALKAARCVPDPMRLEVRLHREGSFTVMWASRAISPSERLIWHGRATRIEGLILAAISVPCDADWRPNSYHQAVG